MSLKAKIAAAKRDKHDADIELERLHSVQKSMTAIRAEMRALMQGVGLTSEQRTWVANEVREMIDAVVKHAGEHVENRALHHLQNYCDQRGHEAEKEPRDE